MACAAANGKLLQSHSAQSEILCPIDRSLAALWEGGAHATKLGAFPVETTRKTLRHETRG